MSWRRYPGWGFGPAVFDPLVSLLSACPDGGALVWSAGSFHFWDDLAAGRHRGPAMLVAPVVRYLKAEDFPAGMEARALAGLRRRIERDPRQGFEWFVGQVFEGEPTHLDTDWPEADLLAGLDELAQRDDRRRVRQLAGRARGVVVACTGDRIVPAAQGRWVAETLGWPFVELAGGSHVPFIERTDDVVDAIQHLLAG